jgi:hypothetical protein
MEASPIEAILEAFRLGGPWMYIILLADLILAAAVFGSLAAAVATRLMNKGGQFVRILSICTALFCFVPAGAGVLGLVMGNVMSQKASGAAHPDHVEALLERGREVAAIPMKFGGFSTLLFLFPTAAAFFLAPREGDEGEGAAQDGETAA